ncbi:Sugar phosphate isomerase/epimerase [Rhodovulum sp. ES.010]|uniref:sugar phosphate isomerase/epimerase family protein n=1 Tax=Rhodovulum sp. ES.010 TaxID=1882821 RepID=UPI00092CBCEE|nr:sugar phosphate isomerase/epimerase family protein [Rhodovulum sp. ES.010]SIO33618.1 Sugar phosphate isomerase/epimerase [Rhodovulum sp. ES.010]
MTRPVIGAALGVPDLPDFRDWLFEKDRDLELQGFAEPDLLIAGDWTPLVDKARRALDGFRGRLGIHGPFIGVGLVNPDPEIRALATRRMMAGLEVCCALGATQMVVHSPYTTWDARNLDLFAHARERRMAAVEETMHEVVVRAADLGVMLVLENVEDVDPADRRRLADRLGAGTVKVSLDTGHAQYAHVSTGARPVDYFVRDAGAALAHVHLQDADGYADRHWPVGQGSIPWHAVFAELAATGAQPRLILELRDKAGIRPSVDWLAERGLGQ